MSTPGEKKCRSAKKPDRSSRGGPPRLVELNSSTVIMYSNLGEFRVFLRGLPSIAGPRPACSRRVGMHPFLRRGLSLISLIAAAVIVPACGGGGGGGGAGGPTNGAPAANALAVTTPEDTPIAITLTGSDPDGNPITCAIASGPSNGSLTGSAPSVTYTPNLNFNGPDSFTFTVSDGSLTSAPATVTITVTAVNDPPVANPQSVLTPEDTPKAITLTGNDPDGDTLTYTIVPGPGPANGILSGTPPNVTYTPNLNFNGSDSFQFTVSDGVFTSASATVSITVTPVNDPPVADAQSVTTDLATAVAITLTGSDPEGMPITYAIASSPANGALTGLAPNVTYTPNSGFSGLDSFTFAVNDGSLTSIPGTVKVAVTDVWKPTKTTGAPSPRYGHVSVWSGREMIVWGGGSATTSDSTGGRYDPITNSWTATSLVAAPPPTGVSQPGNAVTAVWTGREMIVWGASHGRYDPVTDSWSTISTTGLVPYRVDHTAVWTGREMIMWGGGDAFANRLNTGGRYDPITDSWVATTTVGAPVAVVWHTAVWADREMIVWGGWALSGTKNAGGRYDPVTDSWSPTGTVGAPSPTAQHTAVWTGREMIVWGGWNGLNYQNPCGRYDPRTNSWFPMASAGNPTGRASHTSVWTGREMIVWGGYDGTTGLDTGGQYDPASDSWSPTASLGAPAARFDPP